MGIGKDKRYFDRDFKYEAIRLMDEGKRSVRDIAKDLDVHPNVLHQWRRKYRADMDQAFPGKGHLRAPERISLGACPSNWPDSVLNLEDSLWNPAAFLKVSVR